MKVKEYMMDVTINRKIILLMAAVAFFLGGPMGQQFLIAAGNAGDMEIEAAEVASPDESTDQDVINKEKELMAQEQDGDQLLGVINEIGDGYITIDDQAYSLPAAVVYHRADGKITGRTNFSAGNRVRFIFDSETMHIIELWMNSDENGENVPARKAVDGDTLQLKNGVWTN